MQGRCVRRGIKDAGDVCARARVESILCVCFDNDERARRRLGGRGVLVLGERVCTYLYLCIHDMNDSFTPTSEISSALQTAEGLKRNFFVGVYLERSCEAGKRFTDADGADVARVGRLCFGERDFAACCEPLAHEGRGLVVDDKFEESENAFAADEVVE